MGWTTGRKVRGCVQGSVCGTVSPRSQQAAQTRKVVTQTPGRLPRTLGADPGPLRAWSPDCSHADGNPALLAAPTSAVLAASPLQSSLSWAKPTDMTTARCPPATVCSHVSQSGHQSVSHAYIPQRGKISWDFGRGRHCVPWLVSLAYMLPDSTGNATCVDHTQAASHTMDGRHTRRIPSSSHTVGGIQVAC